MPTEANQNQSRQEKTLKSGDRFEKIKIVEVGTSGTEISGNQFDEEYLRALTGPQAADVWDEMRRSDDQVKMLLRVVKNPIMSANWFISPASDDEKDKKIADFVSHVLFEDMGTDEHPKSFKKFQREALTAVEFGYSLFEITQKIVLNDPEFGTYVGIKGLDWRSPKTIEEWYVSKDGRLEQVRQSDTSQRSNDVFIPGKFLLHIALEMEGDNYEGISMIRPIYGNWKRKDYLNKIKMIGAERSAVGVPVAKVPQGQLNSGAQDAVEDSLSRFVTHEKAYVVVPAGWDIESLKIEFDADGLVKMIAGEDIGMAKSFLASFMELGLSGGGAYALGTDLSDIFLSGIVVYADAVTDPVNSKLIPMIVRSNFGPQRKYPKAKIEGINDKAGKEFAEVLKLLGDQGLLQVTDVLKEVVHKRFNLPDFDKDFIEDAPIDPPPVKPKAAKLSEIEYSLAERSVGKNIEIVGKEMTVIMSDQMSSRGRQLVGDMLEIWRNAQKSKRMSLVNNLPVPGKNAYKRTVSDLLADVYVRATDGVKKELSSDGLKLAAKSEIKNLPAESKAAGASQADLLVESQDADLKKSLFFSFTSNADKLPTEAQMEANLMNVVDRYVAGASMRVSGPNAIANAVNLARNAIFQKKETLDKIESFIFQNPSPEAPICVELTGRVFTKEEYVVSDKLPPLHHNCNSWIRAQVSGRTGNKSLSPAGLSIQGTPNQINRIERSITL